jgi:hypothetical protein
MAEGLIRRILKEESCYWLGAARRAVQEDTPRKTYDEKGCYLCSGKNKNCSHYVAQIKENVVRNSEWPYEVME